MAPHKATNHSPIARDPSLYHLTPDASGGVWDLYRVSEEFDSDAGDLNETLIDSLNHWASREPGFASLRIREDAPPTRRPGEILLLDGSPSRLPLTMETARVMSAYLNRLGLSIPVKVLNRREELLARASRAPRRTARHQPDGAKKPLRRHPGQGSGVPGSRRRTRAAHRSRRAAVQQKNHV